MSFVRNNGSAALTNERQCPHIVEMKLPHGGFAHRLRMDIEEFHRSRNIRARFGRRQRREREEFCRWCFADASDADQFHVRFGGVRLAMMDNPSGPTDADPGAADVPKWYASR